MTDQADETIVVKYIVEAQEAIARSKEISTRFVEIKEQLKSMSAQSGQSFKTLADGMIAAAKVNLQSKISDIKEMGKASGQTASQINADIAKENAGFQQFSSNVRRASQELQNENKKTSQSFNALAVGLAAAFGISAVSMVRSFFNTVIELSKQGMEYAYDYAKGLFQIQIGVNALRRAGTEITFGNVLTQLQKLKQEFGVFSMKDLVVGAGQFLNLNRDMGFTEKQLYDLQEAIATLAVVNGRSMDEVQKTVALALSSGYTEGLQRLGVSINRVTIAEEAARLGYAKSYMALTEVQRAEATRILILEKTAVYQKDNLEYQKSLPGMIDKATKSIDDQTVALGQNLLGWKLWWAETKKAATEIATMVSGAFNLSAREEFTQGLIKQREESLGRILTAEEKIAMIHAADAAWYAGIMGSRALSVQQLFEKYQIPSEKYNPNKIGEPPVTPKVEPPLTEEQITAIDDTAKKIIDLQKQYDIDRRDLAIDLQRDLAQIEAEGNDKLLELDAEHAQKMLDIANKASEQIRQASDKYSLDVKQTWDDYYSNVASASEKHNNKLLKIEEDYQEKLRRLKEGFLMDLEGALEQRDARQVLRLIKQYNLDRTQATREHDQNLKEENRAYQEQLHELDRQRADRLRKLKDEFDLRNAELIRQRDTELALEVEAYTKKRLEQEHENAVDKGEREQRYQEDLDDLALHLQDRIKALAEGLVNEAKITATGMQNMIDIINTYVGPGGIAEGLYDYFVAYSQAAIGAAMAAISGVTSGFNNMMFLPRTIPSPTTHAQGGIEVASKPTTAVFGDNGTEVALFLPMRDLLSGVASGKNKLPSATSKSNGTKDKLQVEILLSPDLEGRMVDRTMSNVADVVIKNIKR